MTQYTFSGPCRWAKVYVPDEKFGPKYSIEVKLSDAEMKKYKEAGCQGTPSKDGEGYYTFRRTKTLLTRKGKVMENGPPVVVDKDGHPTTASIGNGSDVTVKVETYPTEKGTGTKLLAVRIDNLIVYDGGNSASAGSNNVDSDSSAGNSSDEATTYRIRNPF